ncbi:hypothetical protein PIROE2DRAFT_16801, partial [Piromyces sp. E2]
RLDKNKLSGSIPESIGQLTQLKQLRLDKNKLSGFIPETIGQLTLLERLDLDKNNLSGSIPESIGQLTRYLNTNQLSGPIPESIGQLTLLERLDLDNNKLNGQVPECIGKLINLKELYLNDNLLDNNIPKLVKQLYKRKTSIDCLDNCCNAYHWYNANNIDCDKNGRITEIDMSGEKLTGPLPETIGLLTELDTIELDNNKLSGPIPESICQLKKDLSSNKLNGKIPECIGDLTKLKDLELDNNKLTGKIPESFGKLTNIKYFGYSYNCFTCEDLTVGKSETDCKELVLPKQRKESECSLRYCEENINDTECKICENGYIMKNYKCIPYNCTEGSNGKCTTCDKGYKVDEEGGCTNCEKGYIRKDNKCIPVHCKKDDDKGNCITCDFGFNNTEGKCKPYECQKINDNSGKCITCNSGYNETDGRCIPVNCKVDYGNGKCKTCDKGYNVNNEGKCKKPCPLYCAQCNDDGKCITLSDCQNIKSILDQIGVKVNKCCESGGIKCEGSRVIQLNLTNKNINGPIPESIGELTELQVLSLDKNKLSGTIPESIGQLTELQELSLDMNKLSGSIPESIGELTQLKELYLTDNQLSGSIPESIGKLTRDLSINKLSGLIPESIGKLTQLNELVLSNNQLNGSIPESFEQLKNLYSLNLDDNKLSGTIPEFIRKFKWLQYLKCKGSRKAASECPKIDEKIEAKYHLSNTNDIIQCIGTTNCKKISSNTSSIPFFYKNNGDDKSSKPLIKCVNSLNECIEENVSSASYYLNAAVESGVIDALIYCNDGNCEVVNGNYFKKFENSPGTYYNNKSFNELQIDKAEQRHLNEQLYSSSGSHVPYMKGLAAFLTKTIPIISSSMKLLFDRFSKTPNVIKSADVVSIGHRNLTLGPYTESDIRN